MKRITDPEFARRIADIDLSKHPDWYRPRLVKALEWLGQKWILHPANQKQPKEAL